MDKNEKFCVFCFVCLCTYTVVVCTNKKFCGYQRCRAGFSFCFNRRCRSCSDFDGTRYGCHNISTWRNCYLYCKEKLEEKLKAEKLMQNQTWQKRFDELEFGNQEMNHTSIHVIKAKDKTTYNIMIGMLIFGLSVTSFLAIFLVYIQYNQCIRRRKKICNGDPEEQNEKNDPSRDSNFKLEETHESSSLILSEETQSNSINESELTLRNTEDNMPEFSNGPERCLLKGVLIQESCNFRGIH